MTLAAEAAGVSRKHVYQTIQEDAAFRDQYHEAMQESADRLEYEVRRRAVEGTADYVMYEGNVCFQVVDANGVPCLPERYERVDKDGKPCKPLRFNVKTKKPIWPKDSKLIPVHPPGAKIVPLVTRKYSDGLAQMLLKARRHEVFGDKVHHTSDGTFKEEQIVLVHMPPPVEGEGGDNGA